MYLFFIIINSIIIIIIIEGKKACYHCLLQIIMSIKSIPSNIGAGIGIKQGAEVIYK
jgi:hypothetical protein